MDGPHGSSIVVERNGFFNSFVDFACLLANQPLLFPSVSRTHAVRRCTHSTAQTQQYRATDKDRQGPLPPKLRPINSGSLLSKVVLSSVLASPAGKRAAERVAPYQLSLGTTRGVEKLIHICRAAYHSRHLVGKNDFENGFNSMSRQKMLEHHSVLFPESTNIFNFFYAIDSPVYLIDSNGDLVVLWSKRLLDRYRGILLRAPPELQK